ncbi:hypothetical protein LOD99_961 [Oopsacas minuta]|uniref:Uncharacterized protein n=1 Tax=Oopsacas minuta TaxID=111878 RepID=A0AAV7K1S6_9METZ|nr:hypothetical protein LOD99_961 [Oopsacas minuta]
MSQMRGVIFKQHNIIDIYCYLRIWLSNNMTTIVFSYKPNLVRLLDSVSACSWVQVDLNFDCLLTGHKSGSIGFTWYPTQTSTEIPYSITLSYGCIRTVTHIATTSIHKEVAIIDQNGSLLLLRINKPREGIAKLAKITSATVELVAGLAWSHSGTSLATLRYTHRTHNLLLCGYLALNAPGSQLSNVSVILSRSITGKDFTENMTHNQHRLAWGRDDQELIISLTNNTLIHVSTQTWQVTYQTSLTYSPRISTNIDGIIHALNSDKQLCIMDTNGQLTYPAGLNVSTYLWVATRDILITVIRYSNTQSLVFFSGEGIEINSFDINTMSPVLDISWREGRESSSVLCVTEEGLYSLIVYSVVPSLRDLTIWRLGDSTKLPSRVQNEVLLRQSALYYPIQLMDRLEIEVSSYQEGGGLSGRRVLKVGKDYLGQEIHLFSFKQHKLIHRNVLKLAPQHSNEISLRMLCKLLPPEIVHPSNDTIITQQKSSSNYSIQRRNNSWQIYFTKNNRFTLKLEGDTIDGEIRQGNNLKRVISIEGEEIIQILGYSNYFQIVMSNRFRLPPYDTLLIVLVFILHAF